MVIFLLLTMFFWVEDTTYVVILTNGQKIEAAQAPRYDGKLCYLILPGGDRTSLPINLVDKDKTENYNKDLAEQREAEKAAALLREQEAANTPEEEKEKKVISLTSTSRLPVYDRSLNSVSGTLAGAGPTAKMVGEPRIKTFMDDSPVYLSKEKVTRYEDHYVVECDVKVNSATGTQNVVVFLKANFADGLPLEQTASLGTTKLAYGETGTVMFNLSRTEDLIRLSYEIRSDIPQ